MSESNTETGRVGVVAAAANRVIYDRESPTEYIDGAPHLKHRTLRNLYAQLVLEAIELCGQDRPRVLDLGAGEGTATLPFLDVGAHVTAVDISETQLGTLRQRCESHGSRLETVAADAVQFVRTLSDSFDIVVATSFLHHVPDYVRLIRDAVTAVPSRGVLLTFQDPMRYDTLPRFAEWFSTAAYLSWRVRKGDVVGGTRRRLRRMRGVFLDDCPEDNVEYHATRNGVDHVLIGRTLEEVGFRWKAITYFSTQSALFQAVGTRLGLHNTFGILGQRIR